MRYLSLYRPLAGEEGAMPEPEHMQAMGRLVEEMTAKGSLLNTEPLGVRALGARVTMKDGQLSVADEDERMGGYALLQAGSREEAIALAKTFLKVAGDGVCEIRQIMEFGPPPSQPPIRDPGR